MDNKIRSLKHKSACSYSKWFFIAIRNHNSLTGVGGTLVVVVVGGCVPGVVPCELELSAWAEEVVPTVVVVVAAVVAGVVA